MDQRLFQRVHLNKSNATNNPNNKPNQPQIGGQEITDKKDGKTSEPPLKLDNL